ncbi:MAG: thioredoxin family protein [Candidatus Omnitrophica bacterium]|nr:thioredoxin family protein [Candidatus Omnitrophota bacterium]
MHVLELFCDPYCPCRSNKVDLVRNIVRQFPDLELREMNALENMHRLTDLGIKMFPFLLLDGEIIKVGVPEEKELFNILSYRIKKEINDEIKN